MIFVLLLLGHGLGQLWRHLLNAALGREEPFEYKGSTTPLPPDSMGP